MPFHSRVPTPPFAAFAADARTMAAKLPQPTRTLLRKLALHITEYFRARNEPARMLASDAPKRAYLYRNTFGISRKFFPGRTPGRCEQRWHAFLHSRLAHEAAQARVFFLEAWAALRPRELPLQVTMPKYICKELRFCFSNLYCRPTRA